MSNRVPEPLLLFAAYLVNGDDRLNATNPVTTNLFYVDFGITPIQAGAITTYRTNFASTYLPGITLPNCPPDLKRDAHVFRNTVADYFKDEHILDKIVASNMANSTDAMIFHIDLAHHDPTFHTMPISDACFAFLSDGGEGRLDIICRTESDSSRPGIPVAHGANTIQFAYRLFNDRQSEPLTPFSPDTNWQINTSSRAHFVLDIGPQYVGKWVVIYFRWYNTKHPNLAGGWSAMYQKVLG